MSWESLEQMEQTVRDAKAMDPAVRTELLERIAALKQEIPHLGDAHAEKIAGLAGAAAQEATRHEQDPALLEEAVRHLSDAVKELEVEHPRTVEIVNGICTMLSNLGI